MGVQHLINEGLVPLGRLELPQERLLAFPNSHVHRVTPLKNMASHAASRRIVVFWLVNPEVRIISTRHVAPQQSVMTREEALEHRLKLMEERKKYKQDWNVR